MDVEQLILAIHSGPLEQPQWSTLVALFGAAFGKQAYSLIFRPPSATDAGGLIHVGGSQYWRHQYDGYFYALDPFVGLPASRAVTLSDFVGVGALQSSEYFQGFMQPIQLLDLLGMDAAGEDGLVVPVRICRHVDEAAFVDADNRLLERLMPHLVLASQTSARLNRVLGEQQIFRQAFAGIAIGTLSLDSRLRLLHCDAMASGLLDAGGVAYKRGQRLRLPSRQATQQLQQQVEELLQQANTVSEQRLVRYLQLAKANGDSISATLQLLPEADRANPREPEIVVHLCDPKIPVLPAPELLTHIFGYTRAEARVAALLLEGHTADHIASLSRVSLNTVRSQIRALYQKTGVSKLTDLIRVLARTTTASRSP